MVPARNRHQTDTKDGDLYPEKWTRNVPTFSFLVRIEIILNPSHMSKKIFTRAQREILLRNNCVSRCSPKSITYSTDFKLMVVKQSQELGLSSNEIFRRAGLDLRIVGQNQRKQCLKRWKKVYWTRGDQGLLVERRGSRDRRFEIPKGQIESNKVTQLEAEVAYLRAENDFLAKVRAKRKR